MTYIHGYHTKSAEHQTGVVQQTAKEKSTDITLSDSGNRFHD